MLVLSRKKNETILIGDTIVLRIVEIRGGNVRIGIEAPQELSIMREELVGNDLPTPQPPPRRTAALAFQA